MSIEENRKKEMGFPKNPDNITKDELHEHFDLNNDGKVNIEEYAEHINYHCENPDVLEDEMQQADFERGFKYAEGGKVEKYIIVRGTKYGEKYYYQKGTNEHNNKWLRTKKGATIFTDIKEAEKYADESDGDIENLTTYAKGGEVEIFSYYFDVDKVKSIENVEVFTNQRKGHKNYVRVDYIQLSKPQTMQVDFRKIPFDTQEELTYIKKTLRDNFGSTYAKGGKTKKAKTWKEKYNKKYGNDLDASNSLSDIAEDTGVSKKGIQQIYNKGIGAYKTNPSSVRPNVKSKEQWAQARVYSAVMGGNAAKVDAKELKMEKGGALKKEFKFDKNFVIYVPSTTDVGEKISKKELEKRVQEVEKYVANEFGGYTETETDGGYKSTSGEIIEEDIVKVSVFANNKDWKNNENKVVKKVKEWSKKWGQEAIGFEFEGDLYYIDADGKFGWGGTILGALVGGYAGYKIGRARPQKKGFDTEKKLINRAKNTRWDKDGGIRYAKGGEMMKGIRTPKIVEFEDGGEVDLFEHYEKLPTKSKIIVDYYMQKYEDGDYDYSDSKKFLEEMEKTGYTFEYGLDNEPYDLRKMKIGGALELVHAYDDDGSLFGTGHIEKVEGGKTYVRFDSQKVKAFDNDKVKPVMAKGGLTPAKAKKMLDDGMAQGKPLTDRQKRYFGAISQGKADKAREKSSMKRGGKTKSINYKKKDYGLDYLYNQLKISRELLDRATTTDEKDILSLRLKSIQKVIDNTLRI